MDELTLDDNGRRERPLPGRRSPDAKRLLLLPIPVIAVFGLIILALLFVWYGCRIEVGPGEFVPLLAKTGKDLDNEMVMAPGADFKGPQFEILKEGRYFRNPFKWQWPWGPIEATVVQNAEVAILVQKYGEDLPPGEVIARTPKQKGIVLEPRKPGRHYINTWAFDVEMRPMVKIEPGFMGVVTLRVGSDAKNPDTFVVEKGERGVQPDLLKPGTHPEFSNPYVHLVTPIDTRSHKLAMGDKYSIKFPSKYGFDIEVEGTIEWAPDKDKLPELFVKFVDEKDLEESGGINNIEQKVILPFARSFFRTVGGSYRAVDYITGDTRRVVQEEVERRLREACAAEGIVIKSVVIKATKPPRQIRDQYERREIARRLKDRYEKEIEMEIGTVVIEGQKQKLDANGRPILDEAGNPVMVGGTPKLGADNKPVREGGRLKRVIFQRKKDREKRFGLIREEIVGKVREAEQYRAVEVTKARKELEVGKIQLEAAKDKAAAVLAKGQAEAAVTVMAHKAEAEGVKAKVTAFGQGDKYAEYALIMKLSPGIKDILSNTDGPFAKLFERFITLTQEAEKTK